VTEVAKALLVDDRRENLLALEAILQGLPVQPVAVESGEAALKQLLVDDFAVLLLDAQMPNMDGFETASHIKRRERTRHVPIIFLTAADRDAQLALRGYAVGAVDYLTKPFDPWVLRAKVAVFVELHKMNRRLAEQAALLRERLSAELPGGPGADQAGVLPELRRRITAVEEELARVRDLAQKIGDTSMTDALTDLNDRVGHLSAGFDALT
jgi:CheY-like chemotaxis protein